VAHFTYPLNAYLTMPSQLVVLARSEAEALAMVEEHPIVFPLLRKPRGVVPLGMTRQFSEPGGLR
jgi:hypothetical protein